MLPKKILKIEHVRLAENTHVASFNTNKGKNQHGEQEKGVMCKFAHGSLISVN